MVNVIKSVKQFFVNIYEVFVEARRLRIEQNFKNYRNF